MKIKDGYMARAMEDRYIVVSLEEDDDEFKGLITMNSSGMYIWELLQNNITYDEILKNLLNRYDAPENIIKNDLDKFLDNARKANLLEE
jgi:hypothetical protein